MSIPHYGHKLLASRPKASCVERARWPYLASKKRLPSRGPSGDDLRRLAIHQIPITDDSDVVFEAELDDC